MLFVLFTLSDAHAAENETAFVWHGAPIQRGDNAAGMDLAKTFVREIEIDVPASLSRTLEIQQLQIGDVGCVVWDAALVLAYYLQTHQARKDYIQEKKIIELGAGTGVVGLVAAACGAKEVILTDLPEMTPLLERNIKDNMRNFKPVHPVINAAACSWGSKSDVNCLLHVHDGCQSITRGFDTILIADCVYYEKAVEPLAQTIYELLSAGKNVAALCSYEDRDTNNKIQLQEEFRELLTDRFQLNIDFVSYDEMHHQFRSHDIHIFRVTKDTKGV